jgi:diguanylate cyclase (GGDEF)-like protein
MGTCAGASVLTWLELLLYSPDGYTQLPRFRTFSIYATLIAGIYAGDFLAKRLGVEGYRLATVRVSLLVAFFSVSMFVGFYVLGWHTHGAIAAIFSSILICLVYSAKLAHLSLAWFGMLAIAGFSLNPMREPLSDLLSTQLSSSWSIFTSLIIPFSIAATMTYIIDRIMTSHEHRHAQILDSSEALETLAHTDPLTGFFNRNKLEEAFSANVANISDTQSLLVALLDLDNFKAVNTSAGHSAGDTVLQHSAERIRSLLPSASLIRLGGDEFLAFSLIDDESEDFRPVLSSITEPFPTEYEGENIWHSLSVGYTLVRDRAVPVSQAIAEADLAMRQAKREGKGRAVGYAPGESVPSAVSAPVTHATFNPSLTGSDIKQEIPPRSVGAAILSEEIDFEFQPILDMTQGDIVAAEALLRWRLPDGSLVPMKHYLGTFVALEWQSPFIDFLSAKRLQLIEDIRATSPIAVHFNFALESLQSFRHSSDVARLVDIADGRNEGLVVELSEKRFKHIMTDDTPPSTAPAESFPHRERAAEMGVKLALDDFGTGQSNLDRLVSYPVQIVKLDRSVCLKVAKSKRARTVIRHTREICDELNIALIAEGIETQEQSDALVDLGVTLHQGFFHFEPMPKDELLEVLHRRAA